MAVKGYILKLFFLPSLTQYLVYVPSKVGSNKVIKSANAQFLEDSFWDWDNSTKDLSEFEVLSNEVHTFINTEEDSEIDSDTDNDSQATSNTAQSIPSSTSDSSLNEFESITVDEDISNQSSQNILTHVNREKPTLRRSSREQWKTVIEEEIKSLKDKGVFKPITHVPRERKPVGSRWVFAIKADRRFKARLVTQGFRQVYGVDYFDTYSPTFRMASLRILLATAAYREWEIHQVDVKTAYLEGDLDEEIFMTCPEGMKATKFVKVNKALYGLKQSGRA
ncbi:hypothetical protein EV44_g0276 [Erysiphe necator]|uniref:Reverse transcriptase Ty1/copia-type domain-containing protein n=1 Tax=Uncinula necator TaxID=52586 RepID=A0A0B1P2T7_UNCNE|nr:hypothetical protein EV44_g0276 [Erysiphe necator]